MHGVYTMFFAYEFMWTTFAVALLLATTDISCVSFLFFYLGNCDTLVNLGKVYHELGLLTKSLLTFERAQKITTNLYSHCHPNHPQVLSILALPDIIVL